ncbi:MAG: DUF1156 domain-containing protein [Roseomonas sp.]|nr:DUF1156 domain-containing protein [Roseomonas sp.]
MPEAPLAPGLAPFSIRDEPSLIERVFPAQKIGVEAQKERKSGAGQTLTALGSYWKGRKPLVLVRACILAALLPATKDAAGDLALLEALLAMDERGLRRRNPTIKPAHIVAKLPGDELAWAPHIEPKPLAADAEADDEEEEGGDEAEEPPTTGAQRWRWRKINVSHLRPAERKLERARIKAEREALKARAFDAMSFAEKVFVCKRPEEIETLGDPADPLYAGVLGEANARLGTTAETLPELIRQLGVARFGHAPVVGDPFAGGGSIPFEAARLGCGVVASDLNPVAAMLTWGALNIIGASPETRARVAEEQRRVAREVDAEITRLGIEHDERGNRAKAFLYCIEVVDPQTGWRVPLLPSLLISRNRRTVARLVPDHLRKRFDILIEDGASAATMKAAELGTVVKSARMDPDVVFRLAPTPGGEEREWRIPMGRLRRDGEGQPGSDGEPANLLRPWGLHDVAPIEPEWDATAVAVLPGSAPGAWRGGDIFLERLFCIQWMSAEDLAEGKARPTTWFAAPDAADLAREARLRALVEDRIAGWQAAGLVPDMRIEPGEKTDEPIRTRGWTHWHHLFTPRQLLMLSLLKDQIREPAMALTLCTVLDRTSRLCRWNVGHAGKIGVAPSADTVQNVFYNQAFNTNYSYAGRSFAGLFEFIVEQAPLSPSNGMSRLSVHSATALECQSDFWIYDPPYADAVHYHEITEFFIAWLRRNAPGDFAEWTWDSLRPYAIQGSGEKFRADMAKAMSAMAAAMPANGLHVCMFTHQDAQVWADMAEIVWSAGLQVSAAWYVSTEAENAFRAEGHVQGTVLLVLRKRAGEESAWTNDLVPELKFRVEEQVNRLLALDAEALRDRGEHAFSSSDIQMAGYAAALEVLTGYTKIDGEDMTRAALRPRAQGDRRGETGIVGRMIELAVQTAAELLVPAGFDRALWERLNNASERFWLKMAEIEGARPSGTSAKLDEYQTFAKAFRCTDWRPLMEEASANHARLRGAVAFGRAVMEGHEFAGGLIRPVLFAVRGLVQAAATQQDPGEAGAAAIHALRDLFGPEWMRRRADAMAIATWLGRSQQTSRPEEAEAARVLAELIRTERVQVG